MAKIEQVTKRILVSKSNNTMVIVVAVTVFISVFSLVSCKALLKQRGYQARVISKKSVALKQLKDNIKAADGLGIAYKDFVGSPDNLIGGNPSGQGEKDGDNGKLVLDALPSKYDFPALASSLEGILTKKNFKITGLGGTDDELAQSKQIASGAPKVVEMPVQTSVSGSYSSIQDLVNTFEKSIRPFKFTQLSLSGNNNDMKFDFTATTYYQPEKTLQIKDEVVK